MGCFNTSGCLSQLPILRGQEVVCFIGVYDLKSDNFRMPVYLNSVISPYTLPIHGVYNEYGSIEGIVRDTNVEFIEKYFKCDIKTLLDAVHRFASESITDKIKKCKEELNKDGESSFHKEELEELELLRPMFKDVFSGHYHDYRFKLCFEHKDIWDSLTEKAFEFSRKVIEKTDKPFWWECEAMDLNLFYAFIEKYEAYCNSVDKDELPYLNYLYPSIFSIDTRGWRELLTNLKFRIRNSNNSITSSITEDDIKNLYGYFSRDYDSDFFMKLYSQIEYEDKSRFYRECREQIEKFQRLHAYLRKIPMTFVFSCEGLQESNIKLYCEVIDAFREKAIEMRKVEKEEESEWEDE